MTPVQRAALRLEMAVGRVNAMTSGNAAVDCSQLQTVTFDRDSERTALHLAVQEATGMDAAALARALSL